MYATIVCVVRLIKLFQVAVAGRREARSQVVEREEFYVT